MNEFGREHDQARAGMRELPVEKKKMRELEI
jgi:hypothetical protein